MSKSEKIKVIDHPLKSGDTIEWRSVKPLPPFFAKIGGFVLRLTKSPLKVLLAVFCGKGRMLQFTRVPLPIRRFPNS
jgi:hypothetical protein